MKILGILFGMVLFFGGFGLIVHGAFFPWQAQMELNIPEAIIGGVLLLTGMGIGMAVNQARQNELIDRLRR